MNAEPTVFVVDDDQDARDSVCALVRSRGVSAEPFSSAEAFLAAFDETRAGCLVTDVRMLGMSGIDLLERLTRAGHRLPVIIISGYVNVPSTVRAMREGAIDVLQKPYQQQELWDTISKALSQDATIRLDQAHRKTTSQRLERLTPGERQVLDFVSKGTANRVIALRLEVSLRTIEDRRKKIYTKLGVNSIAGLMELVIEHKHAEAENRRSSSE